MMKTIMDEAGVARTLKRIAHEIIEHHEDLEDVVLMGVIHRGDTLAHRLQRNIEILAGERVECCSVDFRPWRDDLEGERPEKTAAPCDVREKVVILCDDVLFRGRTVRVAMDGIMSFGRPRKIELMVLVDRGHRELPIRADYVGKNVPTSLEEIVKVNLREYDQEDSVVIEQAE